MLLGSDPACQASYIKKLFDNNVACFVESKENGGESFPDYVGALILGELDKCVALSAVYRKKEDEVAKERRTKAKPKREHSVKSRIDCPSRPFKKRSEPSKMVVSCKTRL